MQTRLSLQTRPSVSLPLVYAPRVLVPSALAVCMLLWFCPTFTFSQPQSPSLHNNTNSEKVLREAISLLYRNKYKQALQHIDNAFAADSGTALFRSRAFALRAAALRGLGASERAVADFHHAISLSADTLSKTENLYDRHIIRNTLLSASQGKLGIVEDNLHTAQQRQANDSTTRNDTEKHLLNEATQILTHDPNNALALYRHGYALFQQQRYDSSAQDFQRAAPGLPPLEAASAHYHAGLSYFFLDRYNDAYRELTQTQTLAPFYAESYFYRGCVLIKQDRYAAAIKDFRAALQHNPNDAMSMGLLGSLLINSGQKYEGCARLLKAAELGYAPALDLMNRYCNKTDDDGLKIVRLPAVTVEANKDINYAQRIKNTKQGISVAQRVNPINPTLRNIGKNLSLTGTATLSDGTTLITSGNTLSKITGMLPLQSMMNPVDCNSGIINTKSYLSLQCIAYFLRQETEALGNKAIDKIVKQLQQLADELTITQAAIDNLSASPLTNTARASSDKYFGDDMAQIQSIYRDFQSLLVQLQKKMEEYEKVLKAEGKIP